jgi:PST family polysaccharide transporter
MKWLALSKVTNLAVSFISVGILARILSPHDFGLMAAVLLVVALSNSLFEGAFGMGVILKSEIDDKDIATTFWMAVVMASAVAGTLVMAAPAIEAFFGFQQLAELIVVSSAALPFSAGANISYSILRRQKRFGSIALYQTGCALLCYGPVSVGLALYGFGVWSIAIGNVALAMATAITSSSLARLPIQRGITRTRTRDVFCYSGYFTIAQFFNWLALSGSNAVVGHTLGAVQLGYYARAWKLLDLLTSITAQPLGEVLLPAFSRLKERESEAKEALKNALDVAVPLFALISAIAVAQSTLIVDVALGSRWIETAASVQILFLSIVPRCCYKITESALAAFNFSRGVALRQALFAFAMITSCSFAAHGGATMVAVASALSITAYYLLSLLSVMRAFSLGWKHIMVIHVRGLVLSLVVYAADVATITAFRAFVPDLLSEICGCATGIIAGFFLLLLAPTLVVGNGIETLRGTLKKKHPFLLCNRRLLRRRDSARFRP